MLETSLYIESLSILKNQHNLKINYFKSIQKIEFMI